MLLGRQNFSLSARDGTSSAADLKPWPRPPCPTRLADPSDMRSRAFPSRRFWFPGMTEDSLTSQLFLSLARLRPAFSCVTFPAGFLHKLTCSTRPLQPIIHGMSSCSVNGVGTACYLPLTAEADVVDIHFHDPSACLDPNACGHTPWAAPLTVRPVTRPPTPPIPRARWERARLREPPADAITLEGSLPDSTTDVASAVEHATSQERFTVYDVYNHARILEGPPGQTLAQKAATAFAHTPQIAAASAAFRVVSFPHPGLPTPQLVIWGDKLPYTTIVPVSLGSGTASVCTVEVPHSYSAIQLVVLMCRFCQLPDHVVDAVADLDARVAVNGELVYPLDQGVCALADTARVQGVLFRPALADPRHASRPLSRSQSSTASSIRAFVRTIDADQEDFREYTVFAEGLSPLVLPVPPEPRLQTFWLRPSAGFLIGPQCGHRVLRRSIQHYPALQICIWDTLGPDQFILPDADGGGGPVYSAYACASEVRPGGRSSHYHFGVL